MELHETMNHEAPPLGNDSIRLSMRTQQLAALAGTTPRALRHYHKLGLLPEKPRQPNGYRNYDIYDLVRVVRIRQLSAAGVPLRKVLDLLNEDTRQSNLETLRQVEEDLVKQLALLEQQRSMINSLIRQEEALRKLHAENSSIAKADRDMLTLALTSADQDGSLMDQMLGTVVNLETNPTFSAWYKLFLSLETASTINADQREDLRARACEFVELIQAQLPPSAAASDMEEDPVLLAYFQEIASDSFSPAQLMAWNDLLEIIRAAPH